MIKNLAKCEVDLLKDASKTSQFQNRKAEEFREMLIARNCISSFDSYLDFMGNKDLVNAIRICWRLGYDDKVNPSNLSGGLMSDFDFIQATPKSLQNAVSDINELKRLTDKRVTELQRICRNVDAFIRNMGWIDGHPTKKRAPPVTKEQMLGRVDKLISTASAKNPSADGSVASGTSSLGKSMAKACISEEADEMDEEDEVRITGSSKKKMNMMDSDSDTEDIGKKAVLDTLLKNVADDCSVVVFRDTEGSIYLHTGQCFSSIPHHTTGNLPNLLSNQQ